MPRADRLARYWDSQARSGQFDRPLFKPSRPWIASRATGQTLEVACGTGANFSYYPTGIALTATDFSPAMVAAAQATASRMDIEVAVTKADAEALPFLEASFDTVVCTFSLCSVPDEQAALAEMSRVLKPGGDLLLADHIVASNPLLRFALRAADLVTIPLQGEHCSRRPALLLPELGFKVIESEREYGGAIERVHARRINTIGAAGQA